MKLLLKLAQSSSGFDGLLQSSAIKESFGFDISKERNMFVAIEKFITWLIKSYDKHSSGSADGGTWYPSQACKFLKLSHYVLFCIQV